MCPEGWPFSAYFREVHWLSAFYTCVECSWDDMSTSSTYLQNVSIKLQTMDTLLEHVYNVDMFFLSKSSLPAIEEIEDDGMPFEKQMPEDRMKAGKKLPRSLSEYAEKKISIHRICGWVIV